jgi:hypothetical protein
VIRKNMEALASCICRIGPSGDLVLFDKEKQIATIGFGMHAKGWSTKRPVLVSSGQHQGHTMEHPTSGSVPTSLYSTVKAHSTTLDITTFLVATGDAVEVEVHATPREDEKEVCSVRMSIELPISYWGQGSFLF